MKDSNVEIDTHRVFGVRTATGLVVASMVGTGIFTTTGFLASDLDGFGIMAAWLVGGVAALAGALCYGELGAMMPQAGGDYVFVRRAFGDLTGYLAGFVTVVAGFCVPLAGVSVSLGEYARAFFGAGSPRWIATGSILLVTVVHARGGRLGARVNDFAVLAKILLFVGFIGGGLLVARPPIDDPGGVTARATSGMFSSAFAGALVLVAFAYTGWNAAAYVAGEIVDPGRILPRSLAIGTVSVTVLYLLVNACYLRAASPAMMDGVEEVGHLAAVRLFGAGIGRVFTGGIMVLLFSTLSAFVMAGPRVLTAMARDGEMPEFLARLNGRGAPAAAVWATGLLSLVFAWAQRLRDNLFLVGFVLSIFAGLAVFGLVRLRMTEPEAPRPYRVPLYPLPVVVFVGVSAWMVVFSLTRYGFAAWQLASMLAAAIALRWFHRRRRTSRP